MEEEFFFPDEVVSQWGRMSCSGGSWGPNGVLYTTGHDNAISYLLKIDEKAKKMRFLGEMRNIEIEGQAIAWDRTSRENWFWGIVKNKHIAAHLIRYDRKE